VNTKAYRLLTLTNDADTTILEFDALFSGSDLKPHVKYYSSNSSTELKFTSDTTLNAWHFLEVNITGALITLSLDGVKQTTPVSLVFNLDNNLSDFVLGNNSSSDAFL